MTENEPFAMLKNNQEQRKDHSFKARVINFRKYGNLRQIREFTDHLFSLSGH